jgi:hypothetical protein
MSERSLPALIEVAEPPPGDDDRVLCERLAATLPLV